MPFATLTFMLADAPKLSEKKKSKFNSDDELEAWLSDIE
ncbi:hypothetical protein L1275_003108 [Flavobacterium sp. HSC-61S13]|nr:hypothetical protein [Flavobacterium sp. HSC-61S13]